MFANVVTCLNLFDTCICSQVGLFGAPMFLVVISSLMPDFASLPSSLHCLSHTYGTLRVLADPLEHEIMPLAFHWWPTLVVVFVAMPVRYLFFHIRWCQASRGLSMLALPFSSSLGSHDISSQPGQVGEERQRSGVVADSERSGSWRTEGSDRGLGFGFSRR